MLLQHETGENNKHPNLLRKHLAFASVTAMGALGLAGCAKPDTESHPYSIEFRIDCDDPEAIGYVNPHITVSPLQQYGQVEVDCVDAAETHAPPKDIVILRGFNGVDVERAARDGKGSSTIATIAHSIAPGEKLPELSLDMTRHGETKILGLLVEDIRASELGTVALQ